MYTASQILSLAGLITVFGLLYFAFGVNFEFDAARRIIYGGEVIFLCYIILLFLQFIPHAIILSILNHTLKNKPKNSVTLFIWGYVIILCILNIIFLRIKSTEGREKIERKKEWERAEKYFYSVGVSCPNKYPISIVSGGLSNNNHNFDVDFKDELYGTYNLEWGEGESGNYNSDEHVLPDGLNLTWCSLIEKHFYTVNVALDKKKLETLFHKGISSKESGVITKERYNEIVLGFQPGGNVAVWLNFRNENAIEIGFYKSRNATNSEIPSGSFDHYIDKVLERNPESEWIKTTKRTNKIPFDRWSVKYRKKYNWKFITSTNLITKPTQIRIYKYNGEIFEIQNEKLSQDDFTLNALPKSILIKNIKIQAKTTNVFVDFDEDDIYSAFEKLNNKNPNKKITVICAINNRGKVESIIAKNDLEKIKLKITSN